MVYRKRRATARPKRNFKRMGRSAYRRRGMGAGGMRTVTETLYAGALSNSPAGIIGQTWTTKFSDVPQYKQYSDLYRQFCIRKFEMILLPRYTVPDPNNQLGFAGNGGWGSIRLAYAVDESPGLLPPVSELDVLQSNGSKVRVVDGKKIVIKCNRPRPDLNIGQGAVALARPRGVTWLNTESADVTGTGIDVLHSGIRTYATLNFVGPVTGDATLPIYDVYYKITFSLRDPA